MASLQLILDAPLSVVDEVGFAKVLTTSEMAGASNPSDSGSHKAIWTDEATRTLMLRPLQLDSTWLNSAAAFDSILRLTDYATNSADTTSGALFEAAQHGNADNPGLFHVPIGPGPAFSGSLTSLSGLTTHLPGGLAQAETQVQSLTAVYTPDFTVPSVPPAVNQIGDTTAGKFICQTAQRLLPNQALFFRWFHPNSHLGFPAVYEFYVGQFKLRIKDVVVEIFLDVSGNGDRTAWQKIQRAPLFSVRDLAPQGVGSIMAEVQNAASLGAHDRSLLWLPYRQNHVLLLASTGQWAQIIVNAAPVRLADNTDWNITRADTVVVWGLTPAAGRIQVQKVKYPTGTTKFHVPLFYLDYSPPANPIVTLVSDQDHGTTISGTVSIPPGYTPPASITDDCPKVTTKGGHDQRVQVGVELSLQASGDSRWTPSLYQMVLTRPRSFKAFPASPVTLGDTAGTSAYVEHATITTGLKPGEGRMSVEVLDPSPYALQLKSSHSGTPVQLKLGTDLVFTGFLKPAEVTPLPGGALGHRITFTATDRWEELSWGLMRDKRDWTGYGHIDAVLNALAQGGVDPSTAELPAGFVAGQISAINSQLGAGPANLNQQTHDLKEAWAPQESDTPATYIQRIADFYSSWYCGFRADGTFFYLPRLYFTTPSVTFVFTAGGGNPLVYDPVTFTTEEPEANVIVVKCADSKTGTERYSSAWIDWASVLNPLAFNWLGREKREVPVIGGTFSCSQINWMARKIWDQTRRRKYIARFEADFVPSLKVGQMFSLPGQGNWRLISSHVKFLHSGVARAAYEGEADVLGYGLFASN
jgi:hypothetical protein